jgi:hypothetical protein
MSCKNVVQIFMFFVPKNKKWVIAINLNGYLLHLLPHLINPLILSTLSLPHTVILSAQLSPRQPRWLVSLYRRRDMVRWQRNSARNQQFSLDLQALVPDL